MSTAYRGNKGRGNARRLKARKSCPAVAPTRKCVFEAFGVRIAVFCACLLGTVVLPLRSRHRQGPQQTPAVDLRTPPPPAPQRACRVQGALCRASVNIISSCLGRGSLCCACTVFSVCFFVLCLAVGLAYLSSAPATSDLQASSLFLSHAMWHLSLIHISEPTRPKR